MLIDYNALYPASLPVPSPHTKYPLRSGRSHSSAAKALGSSMDPYDDNDEIDSGSSDEETDSAALRKDITAEVGVVLQSVSCYPCQNFWYEHFM